MADKKWSAVTETITLVDAKTNNAKFLLYDPTGTTDLEKNPTMSADEIIAEEVYTTSEAAIGSYNGSTLYRKTVDFGALPNNTSKDVAHNITNLSRVVNTKAYAYRSSDGFTIGLNFSSPTLENNLNFLTNGTNIRVTSGSNFSSYAECYVTLEYTKTA